MVKRRSSGKSKLEEMFALQLRAEKIPYVREVKFHKHRNWRLDFVLVGDDRIAVEIEGGTFVSGRHNRPKSMAADMEKYNEACRLGWNVYRFDSEMVTKGRAILYMLGILNKVPR